MAEKKDEREYTICGTFRGYADCDSVKVGWSKDRTSRSVKAMVILEDGRHYQWDGNLSNQTGMDITLASLRTMGWDGTSNIGHEAGDLAGFGGVHALFTVEMHSYNGKSYPRISRVDPLNGSDHLGGAMSADEIKRLNEDIRRHMGATAPRAERRAEPPRAASAAQHRTVRLPTEPATTAGLMSGIMSDEERARRIDAGEDIPARPAAEPEESEDEDEIPF